MCLFQTTQIAIFISQKWLTIGSLLQLSLTQWGPQRSDSAHLWSSTERKEKHGLKAPSYNPVFLVHWSIILTLCLCTVKCWRYSSPPWDNFLWPKDSPREVEATFVPCPNQEISSKPCPMLCNNLYGERIWKRTYMDELLCYPPKTNTTLRNS